MIIKICSRRTCQNLAICRAANLVIQRNIHLTHYDVLNLPKSCSAKDIREAYIKLSKEYHPDKNVADSSHKDFVRVATAYNVLSKPNLRKEYDLGLYNQAFTAETYHTHHSTYNENDIKGTWADPSFWHNRNKSRDKYYGNRSYYGVQGVHKVPNVIIVVLCFIFAGIGVALQVMAIRFVCDGCRKSLTFKRENMLKNSREAQNMLAASEHEATRNGNKEQIERLKQKFVQTNVYSLNYEKKRD